MPLKTLSETRTDGSVEALRRDGVTEFNVQFQAICERLYMKREHSSPDSPEFNRCMERSPAKLGVDCSSSSGKHLFTEISDVLPKQTDDLWAESMDWARVSLKITANTVNPRKANPYKIYYGCPSTFILRPFLSPVGFHFKRDWNSNPHE